MFEDKLYGYQKKRNIRMVLKAGKKRAGLPRGFIDRRAADLRSMEDIIHVIRSVYEQYGFDPVETPLVEYSSSLGKFLPDQDRPNAGVFSFQDDEDEWLSLRYDLTAPLARHVAENFEKLPKPYRSYRFGWVFRNEKPGPDRFRQFLQFDADTVGAAGVIADAEICMMAADTLECLGIKRHDYIIRFSNRKILDGIMDEIGLSDDVDKSRRLATLRSIDKLDKFGVEGVALLLGQGRLDESGDFTEGVNLDKETVKYLLDFLSTDGSSNTVILEKLRKAVGHSERGLQGIRELEEMQVFFSVAGYEDRIRLDPSVVRGLGYYTGPVFEAELLFDVVNESGKKVVFGSVGGGGRYDTLVSRFHMQPVPATGFSIGVSRLVVALQNLGQLDREKKFGPVVILLMDRHHEALVGYQRMVSLLRQKGFRSELYVGDSGVKAQMKYADRRRAPCVLIQGSVERERGEFIIKDLVEGTRLSEIISDNEIWRKQNPAQITVSENQVIPEISRILSRYNT